METAPYTLVNIEDDTEIEGEILEVTDDTILLQRRGSTRNRKGPEVGSSGNRHRNEYLGGLEYNYKLRGHSGTKIYDKMRRSDPVVRRALRVAKTPVLAGRWFVEADEEANAQQLEMKEFIEWCLFENMETNWILFIKEALSMLDFGHSIFEKVYRTTSTPFGRRTILEDLAPRSQTSIMKFLYDSKGRPTSMEMYNYDDKPVSVKYRKLLAFTYDKEGYNLEGTSLLRSAYKPWFFKNTLEKIDAIQKERHGVGVPVIVLPMGADNKADRKKAKILGKNLRSNPGAYIILPPRWEIYWAKIEGLLVNIIDSIKYHDNAIEKNVLADFLSTTTSESGANVKSDTFLKSSRDLANIVYEEVNKRLIKELINYNYGVQRHYPKLQVRRISDEADIRILSFALKNAVGSDIIRPDSILEKWLRREFSLPPKDEDTEREAPMNNRQGADRSGKSERD